MKHANKLERICLLIEQFNEAKEEDAGENLGKALAGYKSMTRFLMLWQLHFSLNVIML